MRDKAMKQYGEVLLPYMPALGKGRREYFCADEAIKKVHHRRLLELRNIHAGRKAFILGNAPSVAKMDLPRLENHITFAVNSAYHLFDKMGFVSPYTCVSDRIRWHELKKDGILEASSGSRFFYCDDWECPTPAGIFSEEELERITLVDQLYWVPKALRSWAPVRNRAGMFTYARLRKKQFSHDVTEGVCIGNSVIFMATQMAAWMGCNPIVLIGVEMNYDQPQAHFHGKKIWTPPMSYEKDARPWFVLFRKALESRGIRWINATVGGKVDDLNRMEFEEIV